MCYDHHVETDDVSKFPVERMKRIKEEHERLFSDVAGAMLKTVTDHTTLTEPIFAKNLRKLDSVLTWKSSNEELSDLVKELKMLATKLAKIPISTRQLFLILVNRGQDVPFGDGLEVSVSEVQQTTNMNTRELKDHFSISDNHGFTFHNGENSFGIQMVGTVSTGSGWPVWGDLKLFCKKAKLELSPMIISLDFSVLDDNG